ncbi:helix-turn-helix transcriptional regulator [Tissierella sp. MB52-C2]|uniref:helix-turn-helix domain-containing protein n=1 Tax=Tissierella sp. MB52-C2 TaxID=3070999 RepID=UPI00280BB749|nr:helix-turn-helix transcriptional regulator [Tissierella sp. MB52-C2]WMM25004.1 helix-turn-helix transcriptional regulator [Tissierella sp. MB52-C2]
MYYNLDNFGKIVSSIRKIETGKYLPSYEILEDLSNILKVDLNQTILNYRIDDFKASNEIVDSTESKFDRDEYSTLENEYNRFSIFRNDGILN